jgi:hypothetical protein
LQDSSKYLFLYFSPTFQHAEVIRSFSLKETPNTLPILKLLLEHGLNLNVNTSLLIPLMTHLNSMGAKLIEFLFTLVNFRFYLLKIPWEWPQVDWRATDGFGKNFLHYCTAVENIRCLVAKGVDVNHQDMDGKTPLHYASSRR